MTELFLEIVNMSISASWLVLTVMVLRRLMGKAPKWINVLLWGIVAVRLVCPFSIESVLSLIPSAETIPETVVTGNSFNIQTGIGPVDNRVNEYLDSRYYQGVTAPVDQGRNVVSALAVIWLVGMALMLVYTAVSYWRLRRRVGTAVRLEDGLYICEDVASPFVLGIFRPRVYLPWGMDEGDMIHVIAHERTHVRRKDHWWKPLGFLLLTIHWFNPLMWAAYVLLCRDIELACDERVIRELGRDARADYSQALLKCSVGRRTIAACPLAFGEVGVKERVKNVLNYKKPGFWIILIAVVMCIVVAVTMLTDPVTEKPGGTTMYFGTVMEAGENGITLQCDDGEERHFPAAEDLETSADLVGKCVCVRADAEGTVTRITLTERSMASTLDEAIKQAVLDMNQSLRYEDAIQCVAYHTISGGDSGLISATGIRVMDEVTVYLHVLHQVYTQTEEGLEEYAGSYIPTVITFRVNDAGEYVLCEYWLPRDGAYYETDIRAKFGTMADQALNGQKYYEKLNARCEIQAHEQQIMALDPGRTVQMYVFTESGDYMAPTVMLFSDGTFQFTFSVFSSYIGMGNYYVVDDRLILAADQWDLRYEFDILGTDLMFDADASSDVLWGADLYDGAILLGNSAPAGGPNTNVAFAAYDLEGAATSILLTNCHNGQATEITDPAAVGAIAEFLCGISGTNGESGKGWSEGSYSLEFRNGENTVLSMAFGDSDCFFYGAGSDGYLIRYTLEGATIDEVTAFLSWYDTGTFPLVIGETYVTSACNYMSPASSYYPFAGDTAYLYTVGEDSYTMTDRQSGEAVHEVSDIDWHWQELPWTQEEFPELYKVIGLVGVNQYLTEVLYQPISTGVFLLNVNGTLRLVNGSPDHLWSVYTLVPASVMGSAQWEFEPASSAGAPGFLFEFDGAYTEIQVSCSDGMLTQFDALGDQTTVTPGDFLYWCPTNGEGDMLESGSFILIVKNEQKTVAQGRVYITSEPNGDLGGRIYTATIVGGGMDIEPNRDCSGAVIAWSET